MAQIGTAISDIATTEYTGTWREVDGATANDGNWAYSVDKPTTASRFEVLLTSLTTPAAGTCTLRFRIAEIDGGVLGDGTKNMVGTIDLYEGTTLIQSSGNTNFTGAWVTNTMDFTANAGSISNWSDVRIRFNYISGGTGSPANRRGLGISWVQIEIPDAGAAPTRNRVMIIS